MLASWLDDYIGGRCDRADMQASFLSVCRSNPDAPWDALALLDQYQRRGRIDVALARSLKADIAQLVFGVANQTGAPPRDPTGDARHHRLALAQADRRERVPTDRGRRAPVRRSHVVPPRVRSGDASAEPEVREEVQERAGRLRIEPAGLARGRGSGRTSARSL